MAVFSEPLQNLRHCGIQATGDDLERYQPCFSLSPLNIRNVATIHIQVYRQVGLGPALLFSERPDTLTDRYQERMFFTRHQTIVSL